MLGSQHPWALGPAWSAQMLKGRSPQEDRVLMASGLKFQSVARQPHVGLWQVAQQDGVSTKDTTHYLSSLDVGAKVPLSPDGVPLSSAPGWALTQWPMCARAVFKDPILGPYCSQGPGATVPTLQPHPGEPTVAVCGATVDSSSYNPCGQESLLPSRSPGPARGTGRPRAQFPCANGDSSEDRGSGIAPALRARPTKPTAAPDQWALTGCGHCCGAGAWMPGH